MVRGATVNNPVGPLPLAATSHPCSAALIVSAILVGPICASGTPSCWASLTAARSSNGELRHIALAISCGRWPGTERLAASK